MKTFALAIAAAALLAPALIQSASAETASVTLRVGDPGYRARAQERVVVTTPNCRMVTVRTKRADGTVIVKKQRRC